GEMGNPLLDQKSAFGLRQHERPQGLALPRSGEDCVARGEPPPRAGGPGHIWQLPKAAREEPLVPGERFELPTNGLQNRCSTTELTRHLFGTNALFQQRREQNRLVATALLPFIPWCGSVKRAARRRQLGQRHLPACPEGRDCTGPRLCPPCCARAVRWRLWDAPRSTADVSHGQSGSDKLGSGIDHRSYNSLGVGAGTVRPGKGEYRWIRSPAEYEIKEVRRSLVELCRREKTRQAHEPLVLPGFEIDSL